MMPYEFDLDWHILIFYLGWPWCRTSRFARRPDLKSCEDTSENIHTSCETVLPARVWRSFTTESQLNQTDASSSSAGPPPVSLTPTHS